MTEIRDAIGTILKTLLFSAQKHRGQRRKDVEASPYINHPIEVAEILARVGGVDHVPLLQAALLHDTVEDTHTTADELEREFGAEVRRLVAEVTDDNSLSSQERKRLQIERTPHSSAGAKQIRMADKISNIRDVLHSPPQGWSLERRRDYLEWTKRVVAGCRGSNEKLERHYDEVYERGRQLFADGT